MLREIYELPTDKRIAAVHVVPVTDDGAIVMGWHQRNGLLETVGGHLEAGETVEEALHREAMEEAGITLKGPFPPFASRYWADVDAYCVWVLGTVTGFGALPPGFETSGRVVCNLATAREIILHLAWDPWRENRLKILEWAEDRLRRPAIMVHSLKYGGIPHYSFKVAVRSRSPELLIAEGEFGRELRHYTRGITVPINNRSVECYWPDRPYNVAAEIAPDGTVSQYYCNITLPPQVLADRIEVVDLDLDLHVGPDLRYEVLDRDEFVENARRYGYPPEVVAGAETALQELIQLLETRAFPFDGSLAQIAEKTP